MGIDIDEYVNSDDAIFHYTKLSIGIENILYTKKFRSSLFKNTNDPREYKFLFLNMIGYSLPQEANILLNNAHPIIDRILRNECRIMCFCSNIRPTLVLEDNSEVIDTHASTKGWNKSRMWAQYGDNHCGLCFVFSKACLEKKFLELGLKTDTVRFGHVKYTVAERMDWEAFTLDGNRLVKEGAELYSRKHVVEHLDHFFLIKHIDYRDENEYRVVAYVPDNQLEYLDITSFIMGVIAGDRTPEVYSPIIEELCRKLEIDCRRVYWDRGQSHLLLCKNRSTSSS